MSAKQIKVPKGWRKLKQADLLHSGDKYLSFDGNWKQTSSVGCLIGHPGTRDHSSPTGCLTYIRRLPKKRASK